MHECIGLAVIALDKTEALHRIEELDGSARLFAGQLPLRSTRTCSTCTCAGSCATAATLHGHRITFDAKVGRGYAPAAVNQRELQRLAIRQIAQASLLNG